MRTTLTAIAGLAATATAALVLAGPSEATFPGSNGLIAFTGKDQDIYTAAPDGSGVKRLTGTTNSFSASFSPDGKTIVLSSKGADLAPHLAMIDADGGTLRAIPDTKAAYDPSFPASGTRIAYASKGRITTIDLDGTHPNTVVKRKASSPSFSPTGPQITYITDTKNNSKNVFTVDANGKHRTQLTSFEQTYADAPSFSPDGKQIVFSAETRTSAEIWVMRANGSHLHAITDTPKVDESRPAFSPDGTMIAFDADQDIFTMNATGGDPVQVTATRQTEYDPDWQPLP